MTAVAVPVAIFVVVVWVLHRDTDRVTPAQDLAHPVAAVAVVVLAVSGLPVWTLGLALVGLVAFTTVGRRLLRRLRSSDAPVESEKRYQPVS